jgi:hypothetical protein
MKLFFTGFAVAAIGLSGISNVIDIGVSVVNITLKEIHSKIVN